MKLVTSRGRHPFGLAAFLAALAALPLVLPAASSVSRDHSLLVESNSFNQVLAVQYDQNGQVYGGIAGDVDFGDRLVPVFPVEHASVSGQFVYDYTDGRYSVGVWTNTLGHLDQITLTKP